jgi:aromatic ring-opening dioxygenase catalytic subunit (LigB family)
MLIPRVLLVPHLPTLLVDEHRGHETPMLQALADEAARLAVEPPDVVVVLSARWDSDGPFLIDAGRRHRTLTDYPGFGVEVRYDCDGAPSLARALVERLTRAGARVGAAVRGADSGVTVPLHFLLPRRSVPVVPVSLAHQDEDACRSFGALLARALTERTERILFVVGGLLSADMHAWNFQREVPEAVALDTHLLRVFEAGDWRALREIAPGVMDRGRPDAGLRHLDVLHGFLGADHPGQVHAYEASHGVGAVFASFALDGAASTNPA